VPPAALLEAAAAGELPSWARATRTRQEHMERVATLLGSWAVTLGLPPEEEMRWRAAGMLHDALRDAPAEELRELVPEELRNLGGKLLHGPAAAARLAADGVDDAPLLLAVSHHTIGHANFDQLGRALFVADYIEPGRRHEPLRLATLRARMPDALDEVVRDVLHARMSRLLREGRPIRSETASFWNAVNVGTHGQPHAGAR
jgi:HD superfamily phosphohydrolase YqeK